MITERGFTSVRGSAGYVHDPRYRVARTPHVGLDVQVAAAQDLAYQVYQESQIGYPPPKKKNPPVTHRFVAMSTLIFPLGSNPSS
jgi:hypothetical protein